MKFEDLKQKIQSGNIEPVYFVIGKDSFLTESAVDIITGFSINGMPELNTETIQGDSLPLSSILLRSSTMPIMSEKRVIKVYDFPFKTKNNELLSYLENPCENSVIIFVSDSLPAFLKSNKKISVVECNGLSAGLTKKWVCGQFEKNGTSVTSEAVDLLVNFCLSDFSKMKNEIEKLSALACDSKKVDTNSVRSSVSQNFDFQIYELINCACDKLKDEAFTILNSILQTINSQVVLIALYNHFRVMFFSKINSMEAEQIVETFHVLKFKAGIILRQNAKFTQAKLLNIIKTIGDFDYKIKTGKMDGNTAVAYILSETLS